MKLRKKRFLILGTLVIIVIVGIFLVIKMVSTTNLKLILKDKLRVEVYEKANVSDFVQKVEGGSLESKEQKIDTSKLGKQTIKVTLVDKHGQKIKKSFEITVVDTTKPMIEGVKDLETYAGEEINLLEGITGSDNSKESVEVKVEGDYNFEKEGTYELFYVVTDSSKNTTKVPFTLTVQRKETKTNFSSSKTRKTKNGHTLTKENGLTYVDGYLIANKTYSLPDDYGNGLTSEAENAFYSMKKAAANDGISLSIISGFRSYYSQRTIYNNYVARDGVKEADTYSARPGHSEHQTGLAMDINSLEVSFEDTAEGKWLNENCSRFGFIIRYPKGKSDETGYMYEPWHVRYVGERLAKELYHGGDWITMETYFGITSRYE